MLATWQGSGPRRALNDVNGAPERERRLALHPGLGCRHARSARRRSRSRSRRSRPRPRTVELAAPVSGLRTTAARADSGRRRGARRPRHRAAASSRRRRRPGQHREDPPDPQARPGARRQGDRRRPRARAEPASRSSARTRSSRPTSCSPRTARTAVGQLADGRFLLVTVDGAPARLQRRASRTSSSRWRWSSSARSRRPALDGGGSSDDGVRRAAAEPAAPAPSGRSPTRCSSSTRGVYAPPPLEPVLSPNGDGVAEKQRLAYKVVRPSTVTASLLGPDGVAALQRSPAAAAPGTYPLDWPGARPDGTPEAEGRWRWVVTRDRRRGPGGLDGRALLPAQPHARLRERRSRPRSRSPRRSSRAVATFKLARAATVTARIETDLGRPAPDAPRQRAAAGDLEVAWDGRRPTAAPWSTPAATSPR